MTLKSNGCLILISALTPRHVMVASKHSLGTTTEAELGKQTTVEAASENMAKLELSEQGKKAKTANGQRDQEDKEEKEAEAHAEVGRRWLRRTLEKSGKTEADLAERLWASNTTAVLEVSTSSASNQSTLIHSSATTRSKSMSLLLRSTGQGFTCMA
jgi:tRNA ligase